MAREKGGWCECGFCHFSPSVCGGKCIIKIAPYKGEMQKAAVMTEREAIIKLENEEAHYDYA